MYASLNKIKIKTLVDDNLSIEANVVEVKQLLVNLIKNGVEAIGDGGLITIEAKREDRFVKIDITDNGIGMTEEEMKKLGTAFYSLKEKGTGIGMMVCYNIIERYNGEIQVTSSKREGTKLSVFIPACSKGDK
jgi:two-component system, sporulation sensor kinase B